MMKLTLEGSMTALVTPFKDGKFDRAAFVSLVEHQLEQGTSALVPCGTTGESATLSKEEQLEVIETCVKTARGRVPIVAGSGKNDTAASVSMTRAVKELGVDAALVVTPYYNKPTQEGLFQHYMAVADGGGLPVVLYNVPGRTGVNLLPETVARLAKHDRVIATKEASGDLVQAAEILRLCGKEIALISGEDPLTFPMVALGGSGVISVTSNVVPGEFAKLVKAALDADYATARELHLRYLPLMGALFAESSPGPVKHALSKMGRMSAEMRLPMAPISPATAEKVEGTLRDLGLLS